MIRSSLRLAAALMLGLGACHAGSAMAQARQNKVSPSFNCAKARPGSIDKVICASPELSQLDRDMDEEYMRAMAETPRAVWPDIIAEQREFIRSRNQCMGGKGKRHHCIAFAYESRIQRLADWIDGSWRE